MLKGFGWSTWVPAMPATPSDYGHQGPGRRIPLVICPVLSHTGPSLSCLCTGTRRTVPMDHTFVPSYRKTLLGPEEILLSIEIPYSREVRCCQNNPNQPCSCQAPDEEIRVCLKDHA